MTHIIHSFIHSNQSVIFFFFDKLGLLPESMVLLSFFFLFLSIRSDVREDILINLKSHFVYR